MKGAPVFLGGLLFKLKPRLKPPIIGFGGRRLRVAIEQFIRSLNLQMKSCPQCRTVYYDDNIFCLADGNALVDDGVEQETVVNPKVGFSMPNGSNRRGRKYSSSVLPVTFCKMAEHMYVAMLL